MEIIQSWDDIKSEILSKKPSFLSHRDNESKPIEEHNLEDKKKKQQNF
jgi:hypothetical protein